MRERNIRWRYIKLQVTDLPKKIQRFIEIMDIDIRGLTFVHLEADPNGKYFKSFTHSEYAPTGGYDHIDERLYFIRRVQVVVGIHELAHRLLLFNDYDTFRIVNSFLEEYGRFKLSHLLNMYISDNNWNEAACEIAALHGRYGRFEKIKKLFEDARLPPKPSVLNGKKYDIDGNYVGEFLDKHFYDSMGNFTLEIRGNQVYDTEGDYLGEFRDNRFYDLAGDQIFEIRGNQIYNTYGN